MVGSPHYVSGTHLEGSIENSRGVTMEIPTLAYQVPLTVINAYLQCENIDNRIFV